MTQGIELVHGDVSSACECFVQVWECKPPEMGAQFRVVRESWNADASVRYIYEIKLGEVSECKTR